MVRTFNFIRIAAAALVLLPWFVFKWASDYVGNAAELASEAWREAGKL